jgi:hypothetical protein
MGHGGGTMASKLLGSVTLVIVLSVAGSVAADVAGASSKDPKTAKEIAALLVAKKLGCKDFAAESTPGTETTTSTVPSELQALFSLMGRASFGTCTVDGQQTALVAFKDKKTRQQLEANLRDLPCPIVTAMIGRFTPPTTQGASPSTTTLKVPLVDVGSRGLIFSTGTAPNSEQLDFTAAAATDTKIAATLKGKLRTFTFQCS